MQRKRAWLWLLGFMVFCAIVGLLSAVRAGAPPAPANLEITALEAATLPEAYMLPSVQECRFAAFELTDGLPIQERVEWVTACDVFYATETVNDVESEILWGSVAMDWIVAQKERMAGGGIPDAWVPGRGELLRDCFRYTNPDDCEECVKYHCAGILLPDGTPRGTCSASQERTYLQLCFPIHEY